MELTSAATLDRVFKALGDPTRRAILDTLRQGPTTVSEISKPFPMSQPAVSKHLKILEDAGLVVTGRDAQRRPRELNPAAMEVIDNWFEPFRREWSKRLDNLDAHLVQENAQRAKR